ncbi:class I SAM-dependent methyltransferase [Novosphingobium terrae]|uniref:class I SAM-dependent methyltransferase n=1 Tax=Novosphingobium terrae TaxID=2726189 RepID=UPI00198250B6|nr:class I SAM-dependent methyltransferase [Novosphingobium terrae]
MTQPTIYQVSDWNGTSGQRWVDHQTRLDAMLALFGEAAITAAAPRRDEAILDIGCGAGTTTRALADHVGPQGRVLGLDISQPLIERARSLTADQPAIAFELSDAARAELPSQGFDLLFSRFGVMFFDNPAATFAHLRLALKAGGRLAFVCWRGAAENDWVRLPMGAIKGLVPAAPPPDPEAPGPFSFGAADRITRILAAAGFANIACAALDHAIPFGKGASREEALDDAVRMAFEVGPLSRALAEQPPEIQEQAAAAVRKACATRPGDTAIMFEGAAWVVTARNP